MRSSQIVSISKSNSSHPLINRTRTGRNRFPKQIGKILEFPEPPNPDFRKTNFNRFQQFSQYSAFAGKSISDKFSHICAKLKLNNAPPLKPAFVIQEQSSLIRSSSRVISFSTSPCAKLFSRLKLSGRKMHFVFFRNRIRLVGRNRRASRASVFDFGKSYIRARLFTFSFILPISHFSYISECRRRPSYYISDFLYISLFLLSKLGNPP